jgi:hypothetical protein
VDPRPFLIPFYTLASVPVGMGVAWILEGRRPRVAWLLLAGAILPVAVYAVLPAVAEQTGLMASQRQLPYRDNAAYQLWPWKNGNTGARRFAEESLDSLPPRAILISDSTPLPPLLCVHEIEHRRPDVEVERYFWSGDRNILPELTADGRRVFVVSNHPRYVPPWVARYADLQPFGLVWEVKPRAKEGSP